jgi:hypothetical protein
MNKVRVDRVSEAAAMDGGPPQLGRRAGLQLAAALALGVAVGGVRANLPAAGIARPREVDAELPSATLRGQGRLRFLGLSVYDARLWVTNGFDPKTYFASPLALEIVYARALKGRLIAERTLDEMQRVDGIRDDQADRWLQSMTAIFPDVAAGDRITGVLRPGESARFFANASPRGEVVDADFARRFFSIWLGPRTSEPSLRQALLGGAT